MELMLAIITAILLVACVATAAWAAGAIYFDVFGGSLWGRWVALIWFVAAIAVLVAWQPIWQPTIVLAWVEALFLVWWFRQKPRQDRDWDPSAAILPRAIVAGDAVTIENVRNFEYRTLADYTPRYETRTYRLSNLKGVDVIFFDWGVGLMCHPVLVYDFGVDGRICMSIEVRFRKGQKYSVVRSLYRQQELIFIAADERDIILRRTKHSRGQRAFLYALTADVEELRAAFRDYADEINRLWATPRWYHAMCANCTTSFYRLPSTQRRCDWRVLANGRLDRALYQSGRLDRTLPYETLRRTAFLNDIANEAPDVGFGDHIRRELERRRHE